MHRFHCINKLCSPGISHLHFNYEMVSLHNKLLIRQRASVYLFKPVISKAHTHATDAQHPMQLFLFGIITKFKHTQLLTVSERDLNAPFSAKVCWSDMTHFCIFLFVPGFLTGGWNVVSHMFLSTGLCSFWTCYQPLTKTTCHDGDQPYVRMLNSILKKSAKTNFMSSNFDCCSFCHECSTSMRNSQDLRPSFQGLWGWKHSTDYFYYINMLMQTSKEKRRWVSGRKTSVNNWTFNLADTDYAHKHTSLYFSCHKPWVNRTQF